MSLRAQALEEFAADTYAGQPVAIDVKVTGRRRRCTPQVEEQLLRIGQEAIRNAMRHAHADRIRARNAAVAFHLGTDRRGAPRGGTVDA